LSDLTRVHGVGHGVFVKGFSLALDSENEAAPFFSLMKRKRKPDDAKWGAY
jgi:hypothetical protein